MAAGEATHLKLTLLPSFAQRWLLPRMARWRAAHPEVKIVDVHYTELVADPIARLRAVEPKPHPAIARSSTNQRCCAFTTRRSTSSNMACVAPPYRSRHRLQLWNTVSSPLARAVIRNRK